MYQYSGLGRSEPQFHTVASQAKINSMHAGLRVEAIPTPGLVGHSDRCARTMSSGRPFARGKTHTNMVKKQNRAVHASDCASPNAHVSSQRASFVFEDNEAVIKMIIKGRNLTLRHVSRTQRVDSDWLIDRINLDLGIPQSMMTSTNKSQTC